MACRSGDMVGTENKVAATPFRPPATPYALSKGAWGSATPPVVGVQTSAESRNYPMQGRQYAHATSSKPRETPQKDMTNTNLKMRTVLGPLTDAFVTPTTTPAIRAPRPRMIKYSDSSSSESRQVSSNPSVNGHTESSASCSNQSKVTVQLTPIKSASSKQPGEEQTRVAVRLLSPTKGKDTEKPTADDTHAQATPCAVQGAVQPSPERSTHTGSNSGGKTAIWAAQPPGSVDARGAVSRSTSSSWSKISRSSFLSPKMSPIRRFTYASQSSASQNSAPTAADSLDRFQVSPLKPSPHTQLYAAPPQQHAYTPWAARSPYAGQQMPAGPQEPPINESFSFPDPHYQQPYLDYSYLSTPGKRSGQQHEPLFAENIPPQGQYMPGTDQPGSPEQDGFFYGHEHMLTMQQGMQQPAYVQGVCSPQHAPQQYLSQQYVPQQHVTQPHIMQQHAPEQYLSQQYVPQRHVPQQHVPQQQIMQQHAPQQYVPQQYVPQQHVPQQRVSQQHRSPLREVAPGLQQQYTPPTTIRQAGEQSPLPQHMGSPWWARPAHMPYEGSPKARRRLARSYMGSPPYVKNLRTPDRNKARVARENLQAAPKAAPKGIPAPASIQGTGAFIPNVPVAKRPAAYVPPALRGARGLPMRSAARSNPFIGKSLEQIAVMCHILNSKGLKVPEVDRATVKELVRQQIAFGKPLFAPWYRDEHSLSQEGSWHEDENQRKPHLKACHW